MSIGKVVAALLLVAVPAFGVAAFDGSSYDDTVGTVPEPETLALFASAVVAWAVVHFRKRK
jgi:hypothetical protein